MNNFCDYCSKDMNETPVDLILNSEEEHWRFCSKECLCVWLKDVCTTKQKRGEK